MKASRCNNSKGDTTIHQRALASAALIPTVMRLILGTQDALLGWVLGSFNTILVIVVSMFSVSIVRTIGYYNFVMEDASKIIARTASSLICVKNVNVRSARFARAIVVMEAACEAPVTGIVAFSVYPWRMFRCADPRFD